MSVTDELIAAAGPGRVYPLGEVPADPGYPYRVIGYAAEPAATRTLDDRGRPRHRFTVQHFAKTAELLEEEATRTREAFDGRYLEFAASVSSWQVGNRPGRDPDDHGVLYLLHVYEF